MFTQRLMNFVGNVEGSATLNWHSSVQRKWNSWQYFYIGCASKCTKTNFKKFESPTILFASIRRNLWNTLKYQCQCHFIRIVCLNLLWLFLIPFIPIFSCILLKLFLLKIVHSFVVWREIKYWIILVSIYKIVKNSFKRM